MSSTAVVPQWTRQEIDLLKEVIAPGLTDQELALFGRVAGKLGLDPFSRQIHAIKRWDRATNGEKLTIQTSIHGLRLIADRTGNYAPGQPTQYDYDDNHKLVSATAYVKKLAGGQWHEVAETAYWSECVQLSKNGDPVALWATKPRVMLSKVAEALAIRRAFPAETSGLYAVEEMEQDVIEPAPAAPRAVAPPRQQRSAPAHPSLVSTVRAALEAGWEQDAIVERMRERYGVIRSSDLTAAQSVEFAAWLATQLHATPAAEEEAAE